MSEEKGKEPELPAGTKFFTGELYLATDEDGDLSVNARLVFDIRELRAAGVAEDALFLLKEIGNVAEKDLKDTAIASSMTFDLYNRLHKVFDRKEKASDQSEGTNGGPATKSSNATNPVGQDSSVL